jgi:hypothetical protein
MGVGGFRILLENDFAEMEVALAGEDEVDLSFSDILFVGI